MDKKELWVEAQQVGNMKEIKLTFRSTSLLYYLNVFDSYTKTFVLTHFWSIDCCLQFWSSHRSLLATKFEGELFFLDASKTGTIPLFGGWLKISNFFRIEHFHCRIFATLFPLLVNIYNTQIAAYQAYLNSRKMLPTESDSQYRFEVENGQARIFKWKFGFDASNFCIRGNFLNSFCTGTARRCYKRRRLCNFK